MSALVLGLLPQLHTVFSVVWCHCCGCLVSCQVLALCCCCGFLVVLSVVISVLACVVCVVSCWYLLACSVAVAVAVLAWYRWCGYLMMLLLLLLLLCRILGKGLGCVLIKSTLVPGKPRRDGSWGREGYMGAMGDKGDSLRATWD